MGICKAGQMHHEPNKIKNNSVIMQISVSNIYELFDKVKKYNGKILNGPSMDKNYGFLFGGFEDIEGNQIWVIENFDSIDFS